MQTPCSAFVTLLTEEGYQRAKLYNELVTETKERYDVFREKNKGKNKKKKKKVLEAMDDSNAKIVPLYFSRLLG